MSTTACSIASTSLLWVDKFHGLPSERLIKLSGGFTGDMHDIASQFLSGSTTVPDAGFVLNESVRVGTKVQVVDATTELSATFIYGQLIVQGAALAAGSIVRTAYATVNSTYNEAILTNDPDKWMWAAGIGPAALALSDMTDTYEGWFLCGGYAPSTEGEATKFGVSDLRSATVKGYLDVGSVTGAAALVAGDHNGTDDTALLPATGYTQETDAYAFTVFTDD